MVLLGLCGATAGQGQEATIPGRVTLLDADATPAITPGPGGVSSGVVALDYNLRSLFVELRDLGELRHQAGAP
jgi:hypothetical protein